ncbi:MAG: glycosyltransferase, partial [Geovibrio sp.]|nr:glycosyltransferase [Geovibrio sp.]
RNIDNDIFDVVLVLAYEGYSEDGYIDLIPVNVRIEYLHSKKLRYSIFKLAKMIRKINPDLIFSTLNGANIIAFVANSISFKKKPIILRESTNISHVISDSIVNKAITKYCYNRASHIVSLSNGVKDDLVNNLGIKANRISVIYNPIEIDNINFLKNHTVKDFTINSDEKIIVSVGRLVDAKGYDTILKAFIIILNKGVNARLIIVGRWRK